MGGMKMARKIRFPLMMKNGAEVHSLQELQENFDLESVIRYFADGKLQTWLEDRYYENEAWAVSDLSSDMPDLGERLFEIFEMDLIQRHNDKLKFLRNVISDDAILRKVDIIALTQDDLYDILDADADEVYLYGETFLIPTQKRYVKYIGLNNPLVLLERKKTSDCARNGISFENVRFEEGADDSEPDETDTDDDAMNE